MAILIKLRRRVASTAA